VINMTDNEIISGLRKRADYNCDCCPIYCDNEECGDCPVNLARHSLDLINRQQEKVEELSEVLSDHIKIKYKELRTIAAEDFAEHIEVELEPQMKALFYISETPVDVSKSHISETQALDKIRE